MLIIFFIVCLIIVCVMTLIVMAVMMKYVQLPIFRWCRLSLGPLRRILAANPCHLLQIGWGCASSAAILFCALLLKILDSEPVTSSQSIF